MIASTPDEQNARSTYLGAGHVDGVLAISSHSGDPLLGRSCEPGVPMVACGRRSASSGSLGYVAADDLGGAPRIDVEHLLDCGRTRIATITGPLDTSGGRPTGSRATATSSAAIYDESLVAHGDYPRERWPVGMRTLLERRPGPRRGLRRPPT